MTTFSKILAAEVAALNSQTASQQPNQQVQQAPVVQQPTPAPTKSTVELYSPYRTVNS